MSAGEIRRRNAPRSRARAGPSRGALGKYLLAAGLALVGLGARPSRADAPPRVLLVGEAPRDLARKLAAEASAVGLRLLAVPRGDETTRSGDPDLVAILRVRDPTQVEIWVRPVAGAVPVRDRIVGRDDVTTGSLAVRVIEQLRARLVELDVLPERSEETASAGEARAKPVPPSAAAEPEPEPEPDVASEPSRDRVRSFAEQPGPSAIGADTAGSRGGERWPVWIETGAGGTAAAGGTSTLQALVALRVEPASWALAAFALLGLSDHRFSAPEGSAEIGVNLFGGRFEYVLTDDESAAMGSIGAGGAAVLLGLEPEPRAPYTGSRDAVTVGAGFVNATVGYRLARWLRLRGTVMIGASAPRAVVEFDGREVAAWGRPFGTGLASLELGIPFGGAQRAE